MVGVAEIAELLGVSRQRVNQLASSYADFPEPEADLAAGRVWSREAVEGWLALHPERKAGRAEGRPIMFERATDRARAVFFFAQDEARSRNHNYVGCEHLVLGLLRVSEGLAARALTSLEFTLEGAVETLSKILRNGSGAPDVASLPFTPRVKRAVELADEAALEFGHNYMGTEHLLLGILREGENVGCRLLTEGGLDLTTVRLKVLELMKHPQPHHPAERAPERSADTDLLRALNDRLGRIEDLLKQQLA